MTVEFAHGAAAAVSLTFDDARPSQLEHAVPVLDRFGVRATFYALPDGVRARVADWRRVAAARHEIGNHSATHPCSGNFAFAAANALEDYTIERIVADIERAQRELERLLAVRPRTFAYPCGQSFVGRGADRASYVGEVARRFEAGRTFRSEIDNDPERCDLAHVEAIDVDRIDPKEAAALVERAIDGRRWLVTAAHDVGDSGSQTMPVATLAELCRRVADDPRVWAAPVVDVARHLARSRSG